MHEIFCWVLLYLVVSVDFGSDTKSVIMFWNITEWKWKGSEGSDEF